jgi:hypothetical protein
MTCGARISAKVIDRRMHLWVFTAPTGVMNERPLTGSSETSLSVSYWVYQDIRSGDKTSDDLARRHSG